MPNPDGTETEQERQARLVMQSHGATTSPAAPLATATADRVKAGTVAPAVGGGLAGDMARTTQDMTAAAGTAAENAATNNGVGGMGIDPRLGATEFAQDRNRNTGLYDQLLRERASAGQFQAPAVQAGQVGHAGNATYSMDDTQGQQIRGQQLGYLDLLRQRASGQGPSVGAAQFDMANAAIGRNALGMAAQARGADAASARRAAMRGIAENTGNAALQSAYVRANEAATAAGQLGGALSDVRGTDTGVALQTAAQRTAAEQANLNRTSGESTTQAGLDTNVSGANAGNALAANQQNIGERQGLLTGAQTAASQIGAATANQGQLNEQELGRLSGYHAGQVQGNRQLIGAGIGALGALGGAALSAPKSDERAKTDIGTDPGAKVDDFLDALTEHNYRYKDPADGAGERHGPMAQELEQSDIGRSVVQTGPDGVKRVDTGALTLALAGAVARMRREMKARKGGR